MAGTAPHVEEATVDPLRPVRDAFAVAGIHLVDVAEEFRVLPARAEYPSRMRPSLPVFLGMGVRPFTGSSGSSTPTVSGGS